MDPRILDKIRDAKKKYEPEGFIILGVFGSYARGEETPDSDVDILYEITPGFLAKFSGYKFFGKIADIKQELSVSFQKEIDIADRSALGEIGKKYILPEVVYV